MSLLHIRVPLCLLALVVSTPVLAETQPQDAIDRNLQERAAREREFHVRLQEPEPPAPRPLVPGETGLKFYLPTPGSEILRRETPPQPPAQSRIAPGKSVVTDELQLSESQRRRQLELQTQLGNAPGPSQPQMESSRQQTLQSQQLQFDREIRSQELGSKIMRDSSRAIGAPR